MTTTPLKSWQCDRCPDLITDPDMALVVWRSENQKREGFLIVHKSVDGRDCDPGSPAGYRESLELSNFLGGTGASMMLSWLSMGPVRGVPDTNRVADLDEFVDLFRRVQVPWYEQARSRFQEEETQHWLSDANEYYPYLPDTLQRTAEGRLGDA
ncbi:hypothetical protein ADK66_03025 [Micromonospora sp. NRRL B-16802]|uniref:hypothetical protein n=1 Tax=Micromonospora sp. NRRL B-16802 TaxID=1415541 RepID=UPI0006AE14B9|nr:hypothetical protein [Micromonospora sp. NRRL B-16802]KOX14987.1 hypothetical protein ADK66_03025 [Micromonospora sp. NRRL B-16802]